MGKWSWDASDKFDRLEIQQKNVTRELLDYFRKKLQIRGAVKKKFS